MASNFLMRNDSKFCRDCGGPLTPLGDAAYCDNTTTRGTQQDPKDICKPLGRETRLFCEFCGEPLPLGQTVCSVCKREAGFR